MANWSDELKIKKQWGVGDLIENQEFPLVEKINYSHIEALSGDDIDNHISIRRGMRNIMDNQDRIADYLSAFVKEMAPTPESSYIFSGILNEFEVRPPSEFGEYDEYDEYSESDEESDFIVVEYKEEKKVYVRVKPGVGGVGQEPKPDGSFEVLPVVLKPQIFSTERELIKVLGLKDWHPVTENVFIYYDRNTDSYHAKINVRIGEKIVEKFFTNTNEENFLLFETGGYKSGIHLLKAISEDSDLSSKFLTNVNSLAAFSLEPVFEIPTGEISTRHIGFNLSGELKMVENLEEIRLVICSFTIDARNPDDVYLLDFQDKRNFLQDVRYKSNVRIEGTLTVQGGQVIEGETSIAANEIILNAEFNQPTLPTENESGIRINRGTEEDDYLFIFRQSDKTFRVGEDLPGQLQAVATREDIPVSNAIPFWNNTSKRFDTSSNLTWSNNNISLTGRINNLAIVTDSARTLTINNANKRIAGFGVSLTFGGGSGTSHTLTLNTISNTNITLPSTGTIPSLEGTNNFSGFITLPSASNNENNSIWIS